MAELGGLDGMRQQRRKKRKKKRKGFQRAGTLRIGVLCQKPISLVLVLVLIGPTYFLMTYHPL